MQGGAESSRDVVGAKGSVLAAGGALTPICTRWLPIVHILAVLLVSSRSVKALRLCAIRRRARFVPVEVLSAGDDHMGTPVFVGWAVAKTISYKSRQSAAEIKPQNRGDRIVHLAPHTTDIPT